MPQSGDEGPGGWLCRGYLLVRELRNVRALGRVLDGDRADVAVGVQVEQGVLVEIASFGDHCRLSSRADSEARSNRRMAGVACWSIGVDLGHRKSCAT